MTFQFKNPDYNSYYDNVYSDQERNWRRICAVDKADHVAKLLGLRQREIQNVLEVGCGTGDVIARLTALKIGNEFVGVDVVDPKMNNDTVRDIPNLSFVRQTTDTLPFEDASFDLVVASHVLEHVTDERHFLKELARVSRRYIYVEVPCELHFRTTFSSLQSTLNIGHINAYSPQSFALTLATSGLDIVDLQYFDHSVDALAFHSSRARGVMKRLLRSTLLGLNKNLAAKLFTYHYGALCSTSQLLGR
jgi:ubiquinone/menaquinone biosynthesis C-methylase UbiE